MQSPDREQFEKHLSAMFGAWNRVCSADAKAGYWKGCEHMSISDFSRACEKAIAQLGEAPDTQLPHVGALWNIKRSLRARPAPSAQPQVQEAGDGWEQAANRHLWNYLYGRNRAKRYHPDATYEAVKNNYGKVIRHDVTAGPEGTRRTMLLVRAKDAWAQCMREEGAPDIETQQAMWQHFVAIAEEQIGA